MRNEGIRPHHKAAFRQAPATRDIVVGEARVIAGTNDGRLCWYLLDGSITYSEIRAREYCEEMAKLMRGGQ
jgi:hypothetical protein